MFICACTVAQIVCVTDFKYAYVVKLKRQEIYNKLDCDDTHPKESIILASATEICILVLFDTARAFLSSESSGAVQAATTISLRTPVESKDQHLKSNKQGYDSIKPVLGIIVKCPVTTLVSIIG